MATFLLDAVLFRSSQRGLIGILYLVLASLRSIVLISTYAPSYLDIIRKYQSIISIQLFGHTHDDQFEIIYEANNSTQNPVSISYLTPSVTPFTHRNPAVRVYEFDSEYNLIDYVQYYSNLTQTQIDNKPTWYVL